jgi:hypothetical protein
LDPEQQGQILCILALSDCTFFGQLCLHPGSQRVYDILDIGVKRARDAHSFALDAHPHLRASLQQRLDEFAATPDEMPRKPGDFSASLGRAPCGIVGSGRLRRVERPHIRDVRHAPQCSVEGLGLAQLSSPR